MPSEPPSSSPTSGSASAPTIPPEVESPPFLQPSAEFYGTPPALHYGALGFALLAPMALLLPPRRISVQNVILSFGGSWCLNQVVYDYTGKSLFQRSSERWARLGSSMQALPPAAERTQKLLEAERAARSRRAEPVAIPAKPSTDHQTQRAADAPSQSSEESKDGVLHKLWMGDEKEGWKEERIAKEREALEGGKGYFDLISEHMSDAFRPKGNKSPANRSELKDEKGDGQSGGERRTGHDR
jgi:hypothetical protein